MVDYTLTIIESPYSADNGRTIEENVKYAWQCVNDSIDRLEAPFASHLFYPNVLNDDERAERKLGMELGYQWGSVAPLVAVYTDHGISDGMMEGITRAAQAGSEIEFRRLGPDA